MMALERAARLFVLALVIGLPLAVFVARRGGLNTSAGRLIEIRGKMAENGGWTPSDLTVAPGEPLRLRLTSDDVMHGFAIGRLDVPAVDVKPGEVSEFTVTLSEPGKYVFYCTRWCGPDHWRMRGSIEVEGFVGEAGLAEPPLYVSLGLDLDAPHPSDVLPPSRPSAEDGAKLGVTLPDTYSSRDYYRGHSPAEVWRSLRAIPATADVPDAAIWDLVAWVWQLNTTPETLEAGRRLYAANCAACHGEGGGGDGVMAAALQTDSITALLAGDSLAASGHRTTTPADFTDAERMLGASPALLQGKIIRGGMGTGMPYWGPIFTEAETWALVQYLWTFQFQMSDAGTTGDGGARRSARVIPPSVN